MSQHCPFTGYSCARKRCTIDNDPCEAMDLQRRVETLTGDLKFAQAVALAKLDDASGERSP